MATRTWTAGGGDNKATTAGNWDGAPQTGDSCIVGYDARGIVWDIDPATVSLVNVTFQGNAGAAGNMTITLGRNTSITGDLLIKSLHTSNTVTIATSTYTLGTAGITLDVRGCLSQTGTGGNVICTSYTQSGTGSVLTGKVDATFTVGGNWAKTTGTVTQNTVCLVFTIDGSTMSENTDSVFHSLRVSGNTTILTSEGSIILTIDSGKSLSISNGKIFYYYLYFTGSSVSNLGSIISIGTGALYILYTQASVIIPYLGALNTNMVFYRQTGGSVDSTISIQFSLMTTGSVLVTSGHATYTMTLDLNGYNLSCNGITVGTRGILLGKTGKIDNSGNLDSSAGTWTPGTSTYITSSASCTIKLAAGGTLYNLIAKTSVIILGANMTITKLYAHINPVIKGAYTLTLTDPTKEYTGMRRPIRKPIQKLNIGQTCAQCGWMQDLGALL